MVMKLLVLLTFYCLTFVVAFYGGGWLWPDWSRRALLVWWGVVMACLPFFFVLHLFLLGGHPLCTRARKGA
jgi:hypothetical protein